MSTETNPARDRILEAAAVLMYDGGYEAVGVAELCRVAEVKKGSFYYFFDSKQQLALEMLERTWKRTRSTIYEQSFGNESLTGIEAIERHGELLADFLARTQEDSGLTVGCRFANFALEMSTRDEDIRAAVADIFNDMVNLARSALQRSVDAGELPDSVDLAVAARSVIVHMEGLMVFAKAHRDPDLLRTLGPSMRRLLT